MALLLHTGAEPVTYEQLKNIGTPPATESYHPLPHQEFVDLVTVGVNENGFDIVDAEFGIKKSVRNDVVIPGGKFFGFMEISPSEDQYFDKQGDELKMGFGLRNSHDKALPASMAYGSGVFVCDNLVFSGTMLATRKNTLNVVRDIKKIIDAVLSVARRQFEIDNNFRNVLKQAPVTDIEGLEMLGILAAHGMLSISGGSNSQFAIAMNEWKEPTHDEFLDRNIWSLYNCCTEATKKSSLGSIAEDNARITRHFRGTFAHDLHLESIELNKRVVEYATV